MISKRPYSEFIATTLWSPFSSILDYCLPEALAVLASVDKVNHRFLQKYVTVASHKLNVLNLKQIYNILTLPGNKGAIQDDIIRLEQDIVSHRWRKRGLVAFNGISIVSTIVTATLKTSNIPLWSFIGILSGIIILRTSPKVIKYYTEINSLKAELKTKQDQLEVKAELDKCYAKQPSLGLFNPRRFLPTTTTPLQQVAEEKIRIVDSSSLGVFKSQGPYGSTDITHRSYQGAITKPKQSEDLVVDIRDEAYDYTVLEDDKSSPSPKRK